MSTSEWIEKNTTLKKKPFSFKGYEFQKDIVNDLHPDLNVIKISQVGLTEVQIRKALALLCRNRGTSLIFSLPNEDMYERVSKARVKPIVNADKVFNSSEDISNKSVRSTEMMQFGQSFLYLVPASETAATSIPADFVFNDEIDLSDQKMISLFNSRMQASKFKISQKFSTPTFPSYGIDLNWQISDQRLYMARCECCGHQNHPEFNKKFIHLPGMPDVRQLTDITVEYQDQLDFANCYVMCERCHEPLDLDNPELRQWIATYPNRTQTRGYRITPFVNSNLSIPYIFKTMWDYQKNEFMRGFYNTVLGLPYSDGNMQIPLQDIQECLTNDSMVPDLSKFSCLWIGVDMGQTCHITIGEGEQKDNINIVAIYSIHVDNIVSHLAELCDKYNVRFGCVDRHPYEPTSRDIFKATNGKIIPLEYRGLKEFNIVLDAENELPIHAQANHTTFLDNFSTRIRKHQMKISGYGDKKQIFIEHLRDMIREETPDKPAHWVKLHGNDHFFHSSAFMVAAPSVMELIRIKTKAELRVSTISNIITIADQTPNLTGISKKRVDTLGYIG
jgi:hypothetical protein